MDKILGFFKYNFWEKRWNISVLCSLVFIFLIFMWMFVSLSPEKGASLNDAAHSERAQIADGEEMAPEYPAFLPELTVAVALMAGICYRFVVAGNKENLNILLVTLKIGKE